MINTKKALRREVLQRLKAAAAADPAQLRSAVLREKLAPWLQNGTLCVGIFAPLPHEVNLLPLLQEYPQHRFVFPLCLPGHKLRFHEVRDVAADMQPGAMNIPEPAPHTPDVRPEDIDLLIVPGVAFTRSGERMGYGGGFYDRFLTAEPDHPTVALCYDFQLVDYIPTEAFDIPVDLVLTGETK